MLSSPSSSLKRRRVESSHEKWLESDIALSLGSSREARLAWDDDFPEQFELLGKIGEGSFSTVWKARERSDKAGPVFALKRINPTCAPSRILEEYRQMKKLGGTTLSGSSPLGLVMHAPEVKRSIPVKSDSCWWGRTVTMAGSASAPGTD